MEISSDEVASSSTACKRLSYANPQEKECIEIFVFWSLQLLVYAERSSCVIQFCVMHMFAGDALSSAHTNVLAYKQTVTLRGHVSRANAICVFPNIVFSSTTTPNIYKTSGPSSKSACKRSLLLSTRRGASYFYMTPTRLKTLGR